MDYVTFSISAARVVTSNVLYYACVINGNIIRGEQHTLWNLVEHLHLFYNYFFVPGKEYD